VPNKQKQWKNNTNINGKKIGRKGKQITQNQKAKIKIPSQREQKTQEHSRVDGSSAKGGMGMGEAV
jgi:hypothetical protein